MKRLLAVIFTFVVLSGVSASAQTADELIQKNIAVRGGLEKLRGLNSLRMTGKLHTDGRELPVVIQIKRPAMARGDVTLQGMRFVLAYDGQSVWEINAFDGKTEPERLPLDNEDAKQMIELADLDGPLADYKAKGNAVELIGKEELEATPVYKLKLTLKNGDVKYVYLDAANYLELKVSSKSQHAGGEHTEDEYYSDYKPVNGVLIAHAIDTRVDGQTENQILIEKIEANVTMDDGVFKMPVKAPEKKPSGP